jgi:hypothetical protein
MGVLTYTKLEDGTFANANGLNERFGKIIAELNGKLDSDNLAQYAVENRNIAPLAVTADKMLLESDVDANGWTYFNWGDFRVYTKHQSQYEGVSALEAGGYRYLRAPLAPPFGVTKDMVFWMGATYTTGIQFSVKPYWSANDQLASMIWNMGPAEFINYSVDWMIWVKV